LDEIPKPVVVALLMPFPRVTGIIIDRSRTPFNFGEAFATVPVT
jgi:hypothetical protein